MDRTNGEYVSMKELNRNHVKSPTESKLTEI